MDQELERVCEKLLQTEYMRVLSGLDTHEEVNRAYEDQLDACRRVDTYKRGGLGMS